MYVSPEGEALKRFHTRDGHGLVLARTAGLRVAFLTREATPFARARARKLGIEDVIEGAKDKPAALAELAARWGVGLDRLAYVGDDEFDVDVASARRRGRGAGGCTRHGHGGGEVRHVGARRREAPCGSSATRSSPRSGADERGGGDRTSRADRRPAARLHACSGGGAATFAWGTSELLGFLAEIERDPTHRWPRSPGAFGHVLPLLSRPALARAPRRLAAPASRSCSRGRGFDGDVPPGSCRRSWEKGGPVARS